MYKTASALGDIMLKVCKLALTVYKFENTTTPTTTTTIVMLTCKLCAERIPCAVQRKIKGKHNPFASLTMRRGIVIIFSMKNTFFK